MLVVETETVNNYTIRGRYEFVNGLAKLNSGPRLLLPCNGKYAGNRLSGTDFASFFVPVSDLYYFRDELQMVLNTLCRMHKVASFISRLF